MVNQYNPALEKVSCHLNCKVANSRSVSKPKSGAECRKVVNALDSRVGLSMKQLAKHSAVGLADASVTLEPLLLSISSTF